MSTAPTAVEWQPGRARSETIQRERALLMGSGERDGGVQQERWRSPVRTPHRAGLQRCQLARSSRAVCAAQRSTLSVLAWRAAAASRPPSRSAAAAQHGRPSRVAGNSSGRCAGAEQRAPRGRVEGARHRKRFSVAAVPTTSHRSAAAVQSGRRHGVKLQREPRSSRTANVVRAGGVRAPRGQRCCSERRRGT